MSYLFNISKEMTRRGKQYRVNTDRFFHIMNEGWFIYMRQEVMALEASTHSNGVIGPFASKSLANSHLQRVAGSGELSAEQAPDNLSDSSGEDWRY